MATSRGTAPQPAYVLHHYDWSESSLIVELYTRSLGRVAVVAKGAKRPTSQLRAVLLPFQPLLAGLGRTAADDSGELHTLRSAEWGGGAPLLGAAAMLPAYYLNELLLKLLPRHDPQPALFDTYADALAALARGEAEAAALRAFELALLRQLGWLPELAQATLTAQPLDPQAEYALDPEAGLVRRSPGLSGAVWVALEAALGHGHPAALRAACAAAAQPLRAALQPLLHYHLGHQPLRTRQVRQGLQRLVESR